MRLVRRLLAALAALIILLSAGILIALWPEGSVPPPGQPAARDVVEYVSGRVSPDTVEVDIASLSLSADILLTEADIAALLDIFYRDNVGRVEALKYVQGYKFSFTEGGGRVRANLNLFGALPAQATADLSLRYEGRTAYVTLTGARLGRIPLPPRTLMDALGLKPVSGSDDTVALNISFPSPFTLETIKVSGSSVNLHVAAKVRSINDLAGVLQVLSPDLYAQYIDQIRRVQDAFSQAR